MHSLKISIIIPVKPAGTVKALKNLVHVDYPDDLYEVIVVEGSRPSLQRNAAVHQASGDIIYFLDDDSLVKPDVLSILESHYLANPAIAAVGGPSLTPADDSLLQKAIGAVLSSLFGGGGVRNRYRQAGKVRVTDDSELILCNLSFRREMFLRFGGLDERLYPNEENELMSRLKKDGELLLYDPDLAVYRSQRSCFRAFVRQIFGYGRGRAEQMRISKEIKLFTLVPSLFILYLLGLATIPSQPYWLPLWLYLVMAILLAFFEGAKATVKVGILCTVLFPTLHVSYGLGFLVGLIRPRFLRAHAFSGNIAVKCIKKLGSGFNILS